MWQNIPQMPSNSVQLQLYSEILVAEKKTEVRHFLGFGSRTGGKRILQNPTELANVWHRKELNFQSWQLVPETQRDWNDVTNTQIPGPVERKSAPICTSCDSRGE